MLGKGNDKRGDADCGGIVGALLEGRMGMANGCGAILFAVAAALETHVKAPREHRVGRRVIGLERQRLFEGSVRTRANRHSRSNIAASRWCDR
jgi:hypothetical protein